MTGGVGRRAHSPVVRSPGWEPTRPRSNPIGIDRVLHRGLSPVETEQCVCVCLGGLGSELLSRRVPDSWTASPAFERAVGVGAHCRVLHDGPVLLATFKKKEHGYLRNSTGAQDPTTG